MAIVAIMALTVCALVACGGEPTPGAPTAQQGENPAATVPPQTLTDLQAAARGVLAERLSVPADTLALVSDDKVQWSDASLGCPQEGMMYAQVITPGHRITFSYGGEHYEVHTSVAGDPGPPLNMVSCEGGTAY
ncbi:MAG: hypothetical protein OXI54_01550 [Chloroflexota bacterium]|nr:hypothetical protein [Chloroflexota bacterium]MDE2682820.1 hypothetical protein [Chloroflexota bacterium]